MTEIIAGIYEIESKLGEGGGGIVYLGRHTRLNKKVVLKADKRTLKADKDVLRREVDMLKGLSHTYIPQVYDFVEENGRVYTVMDYIEGESLEKILEREGKREQKEVIKWALQLLEAISYLHRQGSYGILHGDIKPANIMLKPSGDICLIDFNIALALGEEGAVKVGFSRGYASPEHYGAEYASAERKTVIKAEASDFDNTEVGDDSTEADLSDITEADYGDTAGSGKIVLDVRSDIYSLGAVLYHLFSGRKPPQATEYVPPLETGDVSTLISKIITKAMMPDPNSRYQTADEMMEDFLNLRKNDSRVVTRRKTLKVSAMLLSAAFLTSGFVTFIGLKQRENRKEALAKAAYSEAAFKKGDISKAVSYALEAIPKGNSLFEAGVSAEAEKALVLSTGVYNLADGFHEYKKLELKVAPFKLVKSSDGSRYAVIYGYEVKVFNNSDEADTVSLPIIHSALSDCIFTDNNNIVYAGEEGLSLYNIKDKKIVWTAEKMTNIAVSADKRIAVGINRDDDKALVYDVSSGKLIKKLDFKGRHLPKAENDNFSAPMNYVFTLNSDGSRLAVSFSDGSLSIFIIESEDEIVIKEAAEVLNFNGGFCKNAFAYAENVNKGENIFNVIDLEDINNISVSVSGNNINPFKTYTDETGIYIANGSKLIKYIPGEKKQHELAFTGEFNIEDFEVSGRAVAVKTEDNKILFFDKNASLMQTYEPADRVDFILLSDKSVVLANRDNPEVKLLKLESHSDSKIAAYPPEVKHDEARVSLNEDRSILFDYRAFHIYDLKGNLVKEVELPDSDKIYDEQFIRNEEGAYLEVTWYDGLTKRYGLKDGRVIKEEKKAKPDKELKEEFITNCYRIVSILHETPKVYEKESNKLVKELRNDDYLTYVTETDLGLVTEYINSEGERYGILLNDRLEAKAKLLNLCDVFDNKAVFDYKSGDLKISDIYTLKELVVKASSLNTNK